MKKLFSILIFIFTSNSCLYAQEEPNDSLLSFKDSGLDSTKIYFSFGYNQVNGVGKFKQDIDDFIVGFDVKIGTYIIPNTISVGFTAAFQFYEFSAFNGLADYEYVYSSFDQFLANIKFHSNKGILMPYMEFSAGLGLFYTSAAYDLYFDDTESDTEWLESSFNFLAGLGGGMLIKVTDLSDDSNSGVFIDLNSKFMFGTNAHFVKNDSYETLNSQLFYNLVNTSPVYINLNLGIFIRN